MLLLIELVDLIGSWRASAPPRPVVAERMLYLVTVVAAGTLVAWLAAVAGTLVNSSFLLLLLGAAGAAAAIALPLYLARQVLAGDGEG
jgi:hypothetical protein